MRRLLLLWFRKSGRDLPWRRTSDPYAIVLSEIMLQQTQVDRVIPKYEAFLQELPTFEALAQAKTAQVLRLWSGLGYNRRALNLQRLAQEVVRSGGFPKDIETMQALPGIGPYTAHAVAAFAFRSKRAAPIDTNIRRVMTRVFGLQKKEARAVVAVVDLGKGRDSWAWNHALMDLGATKCTAKRPDCSSCPLQEICLSYPCAGDDVVVPKQKKFLGSDRMYRGRLLKKLHENSILRRNDIGIQIGLHDPERLSRIVDDLVKEGFLVWASSDTLTLNNS